MALSKIKRGSLSTGIDDNSDATAITIDSSENVGIGTTSPARQLTVSNSGAALLLLESTGDDNGQLLFGDSANGTVGKVGYSHSTNHMFFNTNGSEQMRIDSSGQLLVGKTSATITTAGQTVYFGQINGTRDGAQVCTFNRLSSDGVLVDLRQDSAQEGTISVSGSTVSYNGGHLSRWSQLTDGTEDTTIVKGTVMTNLDQMAVWTHAATDDEEEWTEDNEQLNCMAVSSVEGDANVAGVFVNWDNDDDDFNDMNVAMTGDMVIRIASGTTVARGDLLMSAGDGTAKPQDDDIVRSKTIAKVTSTTKSHTYDDGSYLVPCVLMAC